MEIDEIETGKNENIEKKNDDRATIKTTLYLQGTHLSQHHRLASLPARKEGRKGAWK